MCGRNFIHLSNTFYHSASEKTAEAVFLGRGRVMVRVESNDRFLSEDAAQKIGRNMTDNRNVAQAVAMKHMALASEQERPFFCCLQFN